MAKNNQKKEKAARNREYARKFRKKAVNPRRSRPPMSAAPQSAAAPMATAPVAAPVAPVVPT